MGRRVEEPTEKPGGHTGHDGGHRLNHPAFGQIAGARVQGGAVLYGSEFRHQNFVTIRISRSELIRDLARDWHHGGPTVCEVALSEAQWATFVSSLNQGSGVACTLQYVAGEGEMPGLPLRTEERATRRDFSERSKRAGQLVADAMREMTEGIGAALSGKKRDALLERLNRLRRDLDDSLPHLVKSFEGHMETTVERAKVEVDAYVQGLIQRAGLAALGAAAPLQLAGEVEDPRCICEPDIIHETCPVHGDP